MTKKMTRGRAISPNATIKLAEYEKVEALEEWVDKVLEIIGHPEALVTDRSSVWDFSPQLNSSAKVQKWVDKLSDKFGFKVYRNTYIVDIAFELKRMSKNNGTV